MFQNNFFPLQLKGYVKKKKKCGDWQALLFNYTFSSFLSFVHCAKEKMLYI